MHVAQMTTCLPIEPLCWVARLQHEVGTKDVCPRHEFSWKKGKDPHPQDKIQHLDFTKDPRPLYYKTPPCVFYHKISVVSSLVRLKSWGWGSFPHFQVSLKTHENLRGQRGNGLSKNTLLDDRFSARRLRRSFGAPPILWVRKTSRKIPAKFPTKCPCRTPPPNWGKLSYLQLELLCLQLSFFAYSPLRPLLEALSHCKPKKLQM